MIPTPEQRAEWRRLADAATEGPWEAEYLVGEGEVTVSADTALTVDGEPATSYQTTDRILEWDDVWPEDDGEQRGADAAFIAATREAVPALLDALDAAEGELEEAQAAIRDARSHVRRLNANAQRWEAPALREGTHTLLLTLDGAVTVRGGALAAWADRLRTEAERDAALARIEKVRAVATRMAAGGRDARPLEVVGGMILRALDGEVEG